MRPKTRTIGTPRSSEYPTITDFSAKRCGPATILHVRMPPRSGRCSRPDFVGKLSGRSTSGLSIASMPLTASPHGHVVLAHQNTAQTVADRTTVVYLMASSPSGSLPPANPHQHKYKYGPRVGSVFAQLFTAQLKPTKAARPSCASKQPSLVCHSGFSDR